MIIKQLKVYTKLLDKQTEFYQNYLGLKVIDNSDYSVSFKIGYSTLTLVQKETATPYHFAVNIPSNKAHEALTWLKQRVEILKDGGNELIDFENWNAKAIYFYDADKNIVELIARKRLNIETSEAFDQNQFLGISEIGLSVQNIAETYKNINAITTTPLYDGNFDRFCAAGDEQGLFIIIDQNKKGWFPRNDFAYTSDFKVSGDINFDFYNGQIRLQPIE